MLLLPLLLLYISNLQILELLANLLNGFCYFSVISYEHKN